MIETYFLPEREVKSSLSLKRGEVVLAIVSRSEKLLYP
jgi:hypothetical protein